MADGTEPNTAPQTDPTGTEGNQPPVEPTATPDKKGGGTANEGDETVTLKKEDYNNLISQRDKNHNQANANEDFMLTIAKEREIDGFLKENSEKYPDLTRDDLMHLDDPDLLEATADRIQRRFQDVAQKKLESVQTAGAPKISAKDKATRLANLKKTPTKDGFEQMVDLRTAS